MRYRIVNGRTVLPERNLRKEILDAFGITEEEAEVILSASLTEYRPPRGAPEAISLAIEEELGDFVVTNGLTGEVLDGQC